MWLLVVLFALVLAFRRQIFKNPWQAIGHILGAIFGWVLLCILNADATWRNMAKDSPLITGLALVASAVTVVRVARYVFDELWPGGRSDDEAER